MADTPALRNAKRRLGTLLADEEYGPKLARLRGADERRVLDLISQGKGKEARAEILQADESRRVKLRVQRYRTQLKNLPKSELKAAHPDNESELFWDLYDHGGLQ